MTEFENKVFAINRDDLIAGSIGKSLNLLGEKDLRAHVPYKESNALIFFDTNEPIVRGGDYSKVPTVIIKLRINL